MDIEGWRRDTWLVFRIYVVGWGSFVIILALTVLLLKSAGWWEPLNTWVDAQRTRSVESLETSSSTGGLRFP